MIEKKITPRSQRPSPVFRYEVKFDGDPTKTYSCSVIRSNLEAPKFIGFRTDETGQNWIVLEFVERCNHSEMTIQFHTQTEEIEKKKFEFLKWLVSYFTMFNFIFRFFSLKALKRITITIAVLIATPIILGMAYAAIDWSYEMVFDESFDDSAIVQIIDDFRFRKIGNYFREDALDDASDFGEFMKEGTGDLIESAKDKADDLKDTIDDIRD